MTDLPPTELPPTGAGSSEDLPIEVLLQRAVVLAEQLADMDPEVSGPAMELLDLVEAWHREGLTRLAMALPAEAMDAVRADPVVAHLLDAYLAEDDEEEPPAPARPSPLLQIQRRRD